jgi:hypothetical protein
MKTTSAEISVRWFEALNGKLTVEISVDDGSTPIDIKKITTEYDEVHDFLRLLGFDPPVWEHRQVYVELKEGDMASQGDQVLVDGVWEDMMSFSWGEIYLKNNCDNIQRRRPVPDQTYLVANFK